MSPQEFERKLTAILSADVVGYSRLMGDNEAATVKTLETYKGVMFSLIKQHRGRVVDSPGDNLLAEFGSVVDAVQCAVSIQKELQTRNADLPENRRMEFRIGINLGDVIEEDDRIYGDGVNIAARLESLADPGGICISKTAFDYIENKLPFGYRFIGDQTVKNIAKPIGAYKVLMETRLINEEERKAKAPFWKRKAVLSLGIIVILAIAAVLYWKFYPREPSIEPASIEPEQVPAMVDVEETKKTIAVLPFENLSSDPEQEYFVDGLSEEILNSLAQIPELTVIARTSSFSFKGTSKTVQEIAEVLGVENLLEGSVRKAGDALRITAQLVRATDGAHLWSKTFDRELKDIFELQEDIATSVANELKVKLGIAKSTRQLGGTDNLEAYEHYLIAQGQIKSLEFNKVLESAEAAIALDPNFALAWTLKADAHSGLTIFGSGDRAASERDAALNAAERAVELEPNLASAHCLLGWIRVNYGEWIEAESEYRKTIEQATETLSGYEHLIVFYYLAAGHFKKANEFLLDTLHKDPLNQVFRAQYMLSLAFLGNIRQAEDEYEHDLALFGNQWTLGDMWITGLRFGSSDILSIDIVYSSKVYNSAKEHLNSPKEGLSELRRIYRNDDSLSSEDFGEIAICAAFFGDTEFAMAAMEKGVEIQKTGTFYSWLPVFHEVRQLPRFKEFVKEFGLVDYWNKFGWPDICHKLDNGDFECD